ncbi:hypothetical protein B296_00015078 [Ensete ventricosum]|uniref:Glycosyltransferase 2-like domain-containing protein n=1 Tax=Ensete ventricosum TaxID=4639 RepID=A0A426ZRY1_ENSVE|nr:hypothetical protein B296_00015078 [Ensete ventricosum]
MSVMLVVEKAYMAVVVVLVKLFGRRPEKRYRWEPMRDDLELGSSAYPMVLVQIPMYNEKEVYQLSIGAACGISWPSDRIIIQVLDDSTDPVIKDLVEAECRRWASKGVNIKYEIRGNRSGYKAGALKEGMKHSYVKHCDYVAIFDADFQPEPDFLCRTVPFLLHNPDVGLVQARWKFGNHSIDLHLGPSQNGRDGFDSSRPTREKMTGANFAVNSDECLMARMQEMSLDYHFTVEQEVGSSTYAFFGFNGTAGVWRIAALNEAGGWNDRTTVEDMDLAVRASLKGWRFVFLGDLKVDDSCGDRSLHLLVFWILFENVMSLHRTKATLIGLLEAGRVNEWVVTEKLGDTVKAKMAVKAARKPRISLTDTWNLSSTRLHLLELWTGAYLFICGCYDVAFGKNHYFLYLFLQAIAFFVVGFGYVGTFVSSS